MPASSHIKAISYKRIRRKQQWMRVVWSIEEHWHESWEQTSSGTLNKNKRIASLEQNWNGENEWDKYRGSFVRDLFKNK